MINFAALVPHPPIIVPEIGKENTKKLKRTAESLEKLAEKLAKKEPKTLIIITPHGPLHPEKMNIAGTNKFRGNLADFGADLEFEFENNLKLANRINQLAQKEGVPSTLYRPTDEFSRLDHGSLIPLYYLLDQIGSIKILPITYSQIDRNYHFAFGEVIGQISKDYSEDIGIIASGDLSHKLIDPNRPEAKIGQEFDAMIKDYLEENDLSSITKIDQKIIDQVGECAYYSLLILLGAISNYQWESNVLSYQSPFGIGHLVADFTIN